jgi:DNA-3-methyladenine glycosylase II
MTPLDAGSFETAVAELTGRDRDLAAVLERHGPPPFWIREPGFPTLILFILEQQVSLASARAAYDRLLEQVGTLNPEAFLCLDDGALRAVGFSRQKTGYGRDLARAVTSGSLDLERLAHRPDGEVREALTAIRGIGSWTADVYLLSALRRPDVWPAGDLALARAVEEVKGVAVEPASPGLEEVAEPWRPWRAAAARILWHDYLSRRNR